MVLQAKSKNSTMALDEPLRASLCVLSCEESLEEAEDLLEGLVVVVGGGMAEGISWEGFGGCDGFF